jgi:outer membrane biosynthesis protein TonB
VSAPSGARSFESANIAVRDLALTPMEGSLRHLLVALMASFGAHLILLAIFGLCLKFSRASVPSRDVIEVSVIDLPGGHSKGKSGVSIETANAPKRASHPALIRSTVVARAKAAPHRHKAAAFIKRHASQHTAKADGLTRSKENRPSDIGKAVALGSLTPKGTSKGANHEAGMKAATDYGSGTGISPGAGGGIGSGNGGDGPRAIYAPVPSIPDDMRDELMRATAIARFKVSHDGKATVVLLSATDFSELNDIILGTLRKWRFLPATRNGVAVDSEADVRLLISVR